MSASLRTLPWKHPWTTVLSIAYHYEYVPGTGHSARFLNSIFLGVPKKWGWRSYSYHLVRKEVTNIAVEVGVVAKGCERTALSLFWFVFNVHVFGSCWHLCFHADAFGLAVVSWVVWLVLKVCQLFRWYCCRWQTIDTRHPSQQS